MFFGPSNSQVLRTPSTSGRVFHSKPKTGAFGQGVWQSPLVQYPFSGLGRIRKGLLFIERSFLGDDLKANQKEARRYFGVLIMLRQTVVNAKETFEMLISFKIWETASNFKCTMVAINPCIDFGVPVKNQGGTK